MRPGEDGGHAAVVFDEIEAEEFTALVSELGYEFSIGRLENGNVAIGLVRKTDNAGPGYVLGEYSADHVRTMLEGN
jgi:hypothetical protein